MAASIVDISTLFSLSGKTAIVTGGTGGLGLAMTIALASGGADIISIELPSDPGSEALKSAVGQTSRNFKSYHCDVRDPKSLRGIYQTIWNDGVKADILLNCAGVQRRAEAEDFTDEDIELVLDVNLKAILISCQEFAKPLLKEGRPRMTGVMQLTKAFSNEWAGRGIQVNSIHPGYFRTPLTEQYSTDPKYKDFNDYIMSRTPAKRWGEPKDLAGAVIFLASPASDYVSGTGTVVDGGFMGF